MKKIIFSLSTLLIAALPMSAQQVVEDSFQQLTLRYETPTLRYSEFGIKGQKYATLMLDGYISTGEVGRPALPCQSSLLTIPFCDDIEVQVSHAVYDTLPALSPQPIAPMQPSHFKSGNTDHQWHLDPDAYSTDAFIGADLARLQVLGIARDRRLAQLLFSPIKLNPISGTIIVCRSAEVTLRYRNANRQATIDHFRRYHTPAFSVGNTLNQLFSTKDISSNQPVRMVVVAPNALRSQAVDRFVAWKRSQGLLTDLVYTDDMGLLSSTLIAAYLKTLYDEASSFNPAPTFVTLIGDDNLMPVFETQISRQRLSSLGVDEHITDHYYTLWDGDDDLPEAYLGRLSARDTIQLASIVNKTLYYEQYAFEDDSYLGRAALVAGVDYGSPNDNAYNCSDPTMDYLAKYYINSGQGYSELFYYKNNTDFAPTGVTVTGSSQRFAVADTLRQLYREGMGWVNYSAHGEWNQWYQPNFTVNHVATMTNNGRPSVMIGNCCLSNKFDKSECLGEALLRKDNNAGAAMYIGATNSTTWEEDFYWAVGYRTRVYGTMDATYDSNYRGSYDHLFHTHGEAFTSLPCAGQMVVVGNMSVAQMPGSSYRSMLIPYYWEIYELMGDPSLLPWTGPASDLPILIEPFDQLYIHTAPHAYVALVEHTNNSPISAGFADENGYIVFPMPSDQLRNNAHLSITAQGYKPYSVDLNNLAIGNQPRVDFKLYPNPASDQLIVEADALRTVSLLTLQGQTLIHRDLNSDRTLLSLGSIPPGLYLLRITTSEGSAVSKVVVK